MPEIWLGPNSDFFICAKTELQYLNCLECCGASADVHPVLGLFLLLSFLCYSMMRPPPLVEKSFGNSSKQTLQNKYGTVMSSTAGSPCSSLLDTDSGWKYIKFTGDSGPSPTLQKSLHSGL